MDIPSRGLFLVAVALASNHVLIYNDKNVVDCFRMDDTVSAMNFGRFGREENTLVIVTIGGTLNMKILKRTAHFDDLETAIYCFRSGSSADIAAIVFYHFFDFFELC